VGLLEGALEKALPFVADMHAHDGDRCLACEIEEAARQAPTPPQGQDQ